MAVVFHLARMDGEMMVHDYNPLHEINGARKLQPLNCSEGEVLQRDPGQSGSMFHIHFAPLKLLEMDPDRY